MIKEMPPLETFITLMGALRPLQTLASGKLNQLLRQLYEAAQERQCDERDVKHALEEGSESRQYGQELTGLLSKLNDALAIMKEAYAKNGTLILEIEKEYMGHLPERFGTLEQAIKHLEALIRTASELTGLAAFKVHPKKRNAGENKLVVQHREVIDHFTDDGDKHLDRIPGEGFKALDRDLIRKAAEILDGFRTDKGRKLQSYPVIIQKVFGFVRDESKLPSEESIRKMLGRIRDETRAPQGAGHTKIVDGASH